LTLLTVYSAHPASWLPSGFSSLSARITDNLDSFKELIIQRYGFAFLDVSDSFTHHL
jgi:hypothetical protein